MPLTLDTPKAVSQTVDALHITSFTFDDSGAVHIVYDEGAMIDGAFNAVAEDKIHTVTGVELLSLITNFESLNTGSKQGDLKHALYAALITATGLDGTVV